MCRLDICVRSSDSVISTVTTPQAVSLGNCSSIHGRGKRFFPSLKVSRLALGTTHPEGTGGGGSRQGIKLMAHLHLVQRLIIMNGAVSLLSLYAFMVWTSAVLPSNQTQ